MLVDHETALRGRHDPWRECSFVIWITIDVLLLIIEGNVLRPIPRGDFLVVSGTFLRSLHNSVRCCTAARVIGLYILAGIVRLSSILQASDSSKISILPGSAPAAKS
jgi:hypothetical protein